MNKDELIPLGDGDFITKKAMYEAMNKYSEDAVKQWTVGHSNWACTSSSTAQQPVTIAGLLKVKEQMMAVRAERPADVIVMTEAKLKSIAGMFGAADKFAADAVNFVHGIRVRTKRTELGCEFVALMLAQEGKKVLLVRDDGNGETVEMV